MQLHKESYNSEDDEEDIAVIQKDFELMWADAILDAAPEIDTPPHIEQEVSLVQLWTTLFCVCGIGYALFSSEGD